MHSCDATQRELEMTLWFCEVPMSQGCDAGHGYGDSRWCFRRRRYSVERWIPSALATRVRHGNPGTGYFSGGEVSTGTLLKTMNFQTRRAPRPAPPRNKSILMPDPDPTPHKQPMNATPCAPRLAPPPDGKLKT